MRHYDPTPFYRSTVGFDRLFSLLDHASTNDAGAGYPPYNIERTDENDYRITIAVAGFAATDLFIEARENTLTVRGDKVVDGASPAVHVLHQGIAARAFERRFQIADHVQVTGARIENGLLHIDLHREVPEAKKPRVIAISTGETQAVSAPAQDNAAAKLKTLDARAA